MNEQAKALLKSKIDQATLVSFDVFDTLLYRKTNTPETIFDLVGRHFHIDGFRKLRMDCQDEASRRAWAAHQYPHADMEEIYAVLGEHTEIPVDWTAVKDYEIQMERDALTANEEMLEIFRYVKSQGKRVVATSDMYLSAALLTEFLEQNGFVGFDHVYCSADEHKAKFNRELFEQVARKENVPFDQILHVGDKQRDDVEDPAAFGMQTFLYESRADLTRVDQGACSDVDRGLYKILAGRHPGFWYDLGVLVGGPLYMGLYRFMLPKVERAAKENQTVYFLARDGYNLYQIFKHQGFANVEYLYTSRRALTLACIQEMDEEEMDTLPPYSTGQTVGEVLDYLCIDRNRITHLEEAGFHSFDEVLETETDMEAFKKLYVLDREVFLERCRLERENALAYFHGTGLLDRDGICFDCGWQGSSQWLLERFKKAVGCRTKHSFVYFAIKDGEKSRTQLHGMHYETWLFDFYKNYGLQNNINQNVVMYELFFSAPHESVFHYGDGGTVIFEEGEGDPRRQELLEGIADYIREGHSFVEKYEVEITPEISVGPLKRLIHRPTEEEAVAIGNLQNVDGFTRARGNTKYIAYVTREMLDHNYNTAELYWIQGLLKRPDVEEDVKKECAIRCGVAYPPVESPYHLEDDASLRSYQRWIARQKARPADTAPLDLQPLFSIVIPVYNTVTEQLEECIRSVLNQTYDRFELILVDDHSSWDNVRPVLQKYEANARVHAIYRSVNGHISVATNDGIAAASGEFIVFMDCDDIIEPNALYEFAKKLNENPALDFLYSDEDKITEDGKIRHLPFFKPDWSPDLFLTMMYTNHLAAYRTSLVRQVGGLRTAYNGSQDYDFTLRFMEHSDNTRVGHIPKVLYHWRERRESVAFAMNSKNYASEAARHAKEDSIRRKGLNARLEPIPGMSQYRMVYEVTGQPLVSIIIPSKDHPEVLRQCIDSIREFTRYSHYEILVVDNGSSEENRRDIGEYLAAAGAQYIYEKAEFNFSKMCNTGAACAHGEYLLFLNDDIEIFQPEWLERMLGQAQQPHTGAVGAKLFYPFTTTIQHTGVANLRTEGPVHSLMTCEDSVPYYFGWNWIDRDAIAVTGACLLLAADKFRQAGGFDEDLAVAYNDVKLCFALHRMGYYNVVRNDVVAYHHESLSRGTDQEDDSKLIRMYDERQAVYAVFPELRGKDPFLNENLHCYAPVLDLREHCDLLREEDVSQCKIGGTAVIDSASTGPNIYILGWALPDGKSQPAPQRTSLVFKDPYGQTYVADTIPCMRQDVAEHFENPSYLYSGFECVLDRQDLRTDVLPYRMGVMTRDENGGRQIAWCQEIGVTRFPRPRPVAAEFCPMDGFEPRPGQENIQWWVDECSRNGPLHKIRGYAFRRGGVHYRYRQSLILRDQAGGALAFTVQPEERIDVAYSFVKEHYLFDTGFQCYIYDRDLKPGHSYELFIRLVNRYDPADVVDVATGNRIEI